MIIGLTGNIGSGKSEAARIFSRLGFTVINADKVGHELYKNRKIKKKIIKEFGESILTNNKIDRRKLKNIVFYDSRKLKRLNSIVHPYIVEEINKEIIELKNKKILKKIKNKKTKQKNIIIEAALLYEFKTKEKLHLDKTILIKSTKENKIKRALKKGKYSKKEIENILKAQMSDSKKGKLVDFVVRNDGSLKEFEEKLKFLEIFERTF